MKSKSKSKVVEALSAFRAGDLQAPSALLFLLEARAPWEWAAMLAAMPWLRRLPRGDGHPVLVFPGLGAADMNTAPLRGLLQDLGYNAYPWDLGFNLGPRQGVLESMRERIQSLYQQHGEKLSLIGWSLGGVYARELAKEFPQLVRCVITLGAPFSGHPRATHAWRFYQMVSGQDVDMPSLEQIRGAPPVPTTSIFSKSDGVVAWQCSQNEATALAENIEVHASHFGMGVNPLALYAVADRLLQDPAQWQPFDERDAWRSFFGMMVRSPFAAARH